MIRVLAVASIAMAGAFLAGPTATGHTRATIDDLPRIPYIAHRGGAAEVPENSLTGLRAALHRRTAQVLDVDTRLLSDGTPVLMHDRTLDRTTDATGPVRGRSSAQWGSVRVDASRWFAAGWKDEPPPTVAEVLDEFGGQIVLSMEAKDPDSVSVLARLIKERGLERSVLVNTNHPDLAHRIHDSGLLTQLWRSKQQIARDHPEEWRSFVDLLDVDRGAADADLRRALRSGVPKVWAHSVNTRAERDHALKLGFTGIVTDAPGFVTGERDRIVRTHALGEG